MQVAALDAAGQNVPDFVGTIVVSLQTNPGSGTLSGITTKVAASGVATFTDLSINRPGVGYQLQATTSGLTSALSTSFSIVAGPAKTLVFSTQPAGTTGGGLIGSAVQVTALDAEGNTADGFTGAVTVSITAGTGSNQATLSGTTTTNAVAGLATFATLRVDKAAGGYTLTASAPGITPAVSASFDITVGAASQLAFTVPPVSATAGTLIAPAIQVSAVDSGGNLVASYAGDVTVAIGTNPGSATLSGTMTATAVAGVAQFSTLRINKSGIGYTLTATGVGLGAGATSGAFNIDAGPAVELVLTAQLSGVSGGTVITPALQLTARDSLGNTATAFTGNITATIATNLPGGTLSGTTTVAAVNGVATFSDLSIDRAGSGYTLVFTANGLPDVTTTSFDVAVGAASRLVFAVPPGTTTAGATLAPAVTVTALDAGGNIVTNFTSDVTIALGTNPGNGTLSGTVTVTAVAGVAMFSTLSINKSGLGYTLNASSGSVTAATSAPFTINPGAASQLAITVQPTNTTDGGNLTPAVQVTAQDGFGNTASGFTGDVTLGIQSNPSGGTLSGTPTKTAVAGVATYSDLSIDKTGGGYTLVATAPGLIETVSAPFAITPGPATQLTFSVQPVTTPAGTAIAPAIQVSALTALGNLATGFSGNVTITIGANLAGGSLSGTTTIAAVGGVATFATLGIDKAGSGYTLLANGTGLTTATSSVFSIDAGSATQLVFAVQPATTVAGSAITPAVKVTARDGLGNTVTTFNGNVTVAIAANPGGGTLSGTATVAAVAGVATFANLSVNKTGAGYTLSAVAAALTGSTSASFTITPGPATQLAYLVQPVNTTAGAAITPAVQVAALDALGNTATGYTDNVVVALAANPAGGTLTGPQTVAAVAGVASFAGLSVDKSGAGYTLQATATGLTSTTSTAFTVVPGVASQLVITVQPGNTTGGTVIAPAVRVTARDAFGNTASAFTGDVTATIQNNPGGGTLSGTTVIPAVAGVATFSTLSIDKAGSGYTISVASTGLTGATSAPFDILVGAASRLVFTVQPGTTTAGAVMSPALVVTAQDAGSNIVTTYTGTVAVAITPGTGTSGAALSGTASIAAVSGAATFPDLSINKSGSGYTLSATATGLTGATSSSFTINPGSATQLVITVQPTNTAAGAAITPAVQVTARDALGNTATGFTQDVAVAIQANPSSGTLSGTTTVTAAAGVASFSTLSIDKAGSGYTLAVSTAAGGVSGATSNAFSVLVGAAAKLVFTVQPVSTVAGTTITPAIQVAAQDAGGNPVPSFTGTVTMAITPGSGTAGATLTGTTAVAAVGGTAAFSTLKINKTGAAYTLTASANSLTSGVSAVFDVTTGAASQLKFSVQPTLTNAGATITPPVEVTVQDAVGNTVTTFGGNVSVAIGTNPAGGILSGSTTVAAVNGVATFATLSIDKSGSGYTLLGSSAGLSTTTSDAFTIKTGAPTHLVFTVQPVSTVAGTTITPAIQVAAQDAGGNPVPSFTGTVTMAITPGSGTAGA
ncbi:MAG TPA: hypothetical protein VKB63_02715, partial [Gemmatimonadales bacterium]|nr:hypothetical protein [Gemmatimonadales bacterium]